uniref:Uncharacterized protein n=2 Tax=Lotharella globosa TaxID=91324 RepID=A0A7S3YCM5_9EUKA
MVITRDPVGECSRMQLGEDPPSHQGISTSARLAREELPASSDSKAKAKPRKGPSRQRHGKSKGRKNAVSSSAPWRERHVLVQANMDHWAKSPAVDSQMSLPRLRLARQLLPPATVPKQAEGEQKVSTESGFAYARDDLWRVMSTYPIWEEGFSVYATVMSPGLAVLETRIYDPDPHAPKKKPPVRRRRRGPTGRSQKGTNSDSKRRSKKDSGGRRKKRK